MAASPRYKVYVTEGRGPDAKERATEYVAACKYAEDAAALVAVLGEGTTIRLGHGPVLWTEGSEDQSAGESYDFVREVCDAREQRYAAQVYDKSHGQRAAAKVLSNSVNSADPRHEGL